MSETSHNGNGDGRMSGLEAHMEHVRDSLDRIERAMDKRLTALEATADDYRQFKASVGTWGKVGAFVIGLGQAFTFWFLGRQQ